MDALRQDQSALPVAPPRPVSDAPRDIVGGLAAIALGIVAFLVFCGWWVLIPTNIAWLNSADRAMHTLGWMFFRETPWGIPPGASPDLGLELANSIGLVDGLPLFALPLKLVAAWLPQPFQYWGYWLLLSFSLQSLFAYRIARELGAERLMALIAAAFVLITPAFLFRVPMHLALSGHWVILAGLYLYVRRTPPRLWGWPLLVGVTAGIHAYLLAMVLGLWFAAWLQRLWLSRITGRTALPELILCAAAAGLVLWTAGFFFTGSLGSYGYGDYKLNLFWPVIRYGWSQIFPDIAHTKYDYEGLSFLGIGILGLLAVAIVTGAILRLRSAFTRAWLPLTAALVVMMLFAFSKDLQAGGIHLVKLPLPESIEKLFSAFRSTGRFVWPLLYFITIGIVVLVARRLPAPAAVLIATIAFAAQTVDSEPAWHNFAKYMSPPSSTWDTGLDSPFWDRVPAAGYTRVRAIPVRSPGHDWKALSYFAVTHGMATDSAYLGRTDDTDLDALKAKEAAVLETGAFEPNTLYVLDVPSALAAAAHVEPDDLLSIVDRRIVFARHGAALVDGLGISPRAVMDGGTWVPAVAYGAVSTN